VVANDALRHTAIDQHRKLAIWLSASDALVLDSLLTRYQEADPQTLNPNPSEYHALMHVAGQLEKWVEYESEVTPERYQDALAEAYADLAGPAGYRGDAPHGPPPA
jgi:hypothetical protein